VLKHAARHAALLALLLPAWTFAASAEEAPKLTLLRAIELAEQNNPALAAAGAMSEAAAAGVLEAQAASWPQIELGADLARTTDPVRVFGGLLAQEKFGPENFDVDFLNRPDPLTHATTHIDLKAPVYTAGRLKAVRLAAGSNFEATKADFERGRQELVRQVIDAFTGDLLVQDQIRTVEQAQKTAEENRRLVADLYDSGLVVESDLLQARVRVSELEEMLVTARAGAVVRRAGLNTVLGLPAATVWELERALPESFGQEKLGISLEDALAVASERRPDLAAATARARAASQMAQLRRAERRPEVGAGASFEAASNVPFGVDGSHWSVGLSAKVTLFDGGAKKARQSRAEAEAKAAQAAERLLRSRAELEVRQAHEWQKAAAQRLMTSQEAAHLAERSLEIVRDRYREGLTPLVELLAAESALSAAQNRELEARRSQLISRAELALATGSL